MTATPFSRAPTLSDRADVLHGFFDRTGGVSDGPYHSLNVGSAVGDVPAHVADNRARVACAFAYPPLALRFAAQVHGIRAATLSAGGPAPGEADLLLTREPGVLLGLYTADCAPLLLAAPGGVAAAHAGWRGTAAGIARVAVRALCALSGALPKDVSAAIGPTIGPCCYGVSADVAARLRAVPAAAADKALGVRPGPAGAWQADLAALNAGVLAAAGVPRTHLWRSPRCSACDPLLFSHRRDQGRTGRQAAVIGRRARP